MVGFRGPQGTSNTGLGPEADEQIRMFATEAAHDNPKVQSTIAKYAQVEKKCFGATGDPFAAPALVPEDLVAPEKREYQGMGDTHELSGNVCSVQLNVD